MRKLSKKLLLSILSVALVFIALGTTTFAWFSMNTTVSVTGMNVTTKVNNNLLIAGDTTTGTTALQESAFKTSYDANFASKLLEPVSTTDATHFFYNKANNVQGSGAAIAASYETYAEGDAFDLNYGLNGTNGTSDAYGYVDYAFQLKAVNTDTSNPAYVNITSLNLVYGGNETLREYAFRVAVLSHDMGTSLVAPTNAFSLVTILKNSSAAYFDGTAVTSTSAKGTVTSLGSAALIGTVPAGTTHYFKVVVRLWLEGEDTTCKNDIFATLNDQWALDVMIKLESATGGVTELNQAITATKIDLSTDSASATTLIIDGVTYYQLTTNNTYYSSTATLGASSRIFKLVENHPIEVTNQCLLP